DEDYGPCTILGDALYPEQPARFYGDDGQVIDVQGTSVQVWHGVQTFRLSPGAAPLALRDGAPCGYERRVGRGRALLLGTWPVAAINLATAVPEVTVPSYRPITAAHLALARALHGRPPACAAGDRRAQARLLRQREGRAATVSIVNRYEVDIRVAVETRHAGR